MKNSKNKSKINNSKGITLIALVVTIIVLIILAGISINLVLGENGIITKAKEASKNYIDSSNTEKEELTKIENEIEDILKIKVEEIKLNTDTLQMKIGEEEILIPTILPDNASNKNVLWSSTNEEVATISDGKVIAKSAGTTTIKATIEDDSEKSDTCIVIVDYPKVEEIKLNTDTLQMKIGEEEILIPTILPDNASNKNVLWSSTNEEVATISDGKVIAKSAGTTTIKATIEDDSEKSDTCIVTVDYPTIGEKAKKGSYIKYNSGNNGIIMCRVLYTAESKNGLQIISNTSLKNITLGGANINTAKSSYAGVISLLNNEAINYLNKNYATDARCVGSNPSNKGAESSEYVSGCKKEDNNYITDWEALQNTSMLIIERDYWLASRYINYVANVGNVFSVRRIDTDGSLQTRGLFDIYVKGNTYPRSPEAGFRPCIKLKENIKVIDGDGLTEKTAYILE